MSAYHGRRIYLMVKLFAPLAAAKVTATLIATLF